MGTNRRSTLWCDLDGCWYLYSGSVSLIDPTILLHEEAVLLGLSDAGYLNTREGRARDASPLQPDWYAKPLD